MLWWIKFASGSIQPPSKCQVPPLASWRRCSKLLRTQPSPGKLDCGEFAKLDWGEFAKIVRSEDCSWVWIIGVVTWGSLGQGSRGSLGVMDSSRLWWFREYICETGFDRNTPHVFRSDIHSDPRCDTVHWNEASIKPSHLGYVCWVAFF